MRLCFMCISWARFQHQQWSKGVTIYNNRDTFAGALLWTFLQNGAPNSCNLAQPHLDLWSACCWSSKRGSACFLWKIKHPSSTITPTPPRAWKNQHPGDQAYNILQPAIVVKLYSKLSYRYTVWYSPKHQANPTIIIQDSFRMKP